MNKKVKDKEKADEYYLRAKHYIFVGMVGVGCFLIQWVIVFRENVIHPISVKSQFDNYLLL